MDAATRREREAVALVLGSDVIGSAIAHGLHEAGWDVVLIDEIDPATPYRGMSFANAWYVGSAEVEGVAACFCSSVRSIPSVLQRQKLIAATAWSWQGVATALVPELLVDARAADGGRREALLARAPDGLLTVGCGPGYVAGVDAAIAVDTSDARAGNATSGGAIPIDSDLAMSHNVAGAVGLIVAPRTGRMRTPCRIGDLVAAGDAVGDIHAVPLIAPISGALRGLSARGARVSAGRVVVEVDPRGDPVRCYGLDERGKRVAEGVVAAVNKWQLPSMRPITFRPGLMLEPRS